MFKTFLIGELLIWLSRIQHLAILLIIVVFVCSSIGVIYSSHLTRQMYAELQSLQSDQDDLDSEYEKLLLEQSAWSNYTRVDQLAREELAMIIPSRESLIVVKQSTGRAKGVSSDVRSNTSQSAAAHEAQTSHLGNELAFEVSSP